jgi:hypothetical protein
LADYLFFDVESQDRATSTYDYCLNDEKASALGAPRLLPMAIARFGTSQTNLSSIHRRYEAGGYHSQIIYVILLSLTDLTAY